MSNIALIYTLFPDAAEAEAACRTLLGEGLVACANRMAPCISHYMWEGEMRGEEEHPVLFKADPGKAPAVRSRLTEIHSYQLPAILVWEAAADDAFGGWVAQQVV